MNRTRPIKAASAPTTAATIPMDPASHSCLPPPISLSVQSAARKPTIHIPPAISSHPHQGRAEGFMRRDQSRGWRALLKALVLGAPRSSVCRQVSSWAPLFSVQRWAYHFPLMYALWRDFCSLPYRISSLHERGLGNSGLDFRTVAAECRVGSDEYQSRIEGIQNLETRCPWMTLFDAVTFLEGHRAGVEYCTRMGIPRSQETASANPDVTHSMPLRATQQDSKRDPSSLPASQG